ncbi:FecR domain-containing protein [uncultured Gilvimarinus sp.]|mgnify:CR=1 FL=1|uniref:FecR family protein n=1 Tax=uncultured Gilvimarinus sp. TaxID=1689143 RepID=UPI0030EF6793
MSNVLRFESRDDIDQRACRWVAAMDRGLSTAERSQLSRWLKQHPAHERALYECAQLWDNMDQLSRLAELFPEVNPSPRRRPLLLSAAASVLFVVCLSVALMISGVAQPGWFNQALLSSAPSKGVLTTAKGERRSIALSDGSRLTLNTNSQLELDFNARYRDILLRRGELNVQVAHDSSRPLRVFAGGKLVEAVGTAFNVQLLEDNRVELIVTEGKVLAAHARAADAPQTRANTNYSRIDPAVKPVGARERLVLAQAETDVERMSDADVNTLLSWQRGELVFRGETLAQAIAEVSRYTDTRITFADPELKSIRIAGLFRAGDVDGLLAGLQNNFSIGHRYLDDNSIELNTLTD